ncbi:MAG: chloride channel protein [Rhizobiaceae bacterium]
MAIESLRSATRPRLLAGLKHIVGSFKAPGLFIVLLACAVGIISGGLVAAMSWIVQQMHWYLFGLPKGARLSSMFALFEPSRALVPLAGGVIMGISIAWLRYRKYRTPVDPIEANALHGGRLSLTDSFIIAFQTIVSSGFGASVGLEAGYAQMGSGVASRIGRSLGLRRNDVRMLVGCGAAAAIAAAFDAPLTGAFYGFELIIGVYTIVNVAPVLAAALMGSVTAGLLKASQFPVHLDSVPHMTPNQYLPYLLLGLLGGAVSIAIMLFVTLVERAFSSLSIDATLRPAIGGCLVGLLALGTPQVLSSGHGAFELQMAMNYGLKVVAGVFIMKLAASAISLGSGFRGGLFFASLFLGLLLGKLFAAAMAVVSPQTGIDPGLAAVVGMTSLAVGVVGGPLTMTFLALESSGDLTLTAVVLAGSILSAMVVREGFGYSFSTWRLHLRGETIRSAHDVGWMRSLTVGSMMRADVRTVDANTPIREFRKLFPLGSAQRVVAVDADQHYAGILIVPELHADQADAGAEKGAPVAELAKFKETVLLPSMNVKIAAQAFTASGSEELAVVDDKYDRTVVGLLTEGHLLRRYAEELEKARRDLSGEAAL